MKGILDDTTFAADDRGVSEVIGAILIFGLIVAMLTLVQTQLIPQANEEVELEHSIDVRNDLVKFHQTATEVSANGRTQSVGIKTGMGYPQRLLFLNPPRVQGTLRTTESSTVQLSNVVAEDDEVNDYFAATGNDLSLDSRTMAYSVNYNRLSTSPTMRYEYGVLYTEYEDGVTLHNPGAIVNGNNINLVFTAGEHSETAASVQSLSVRPNSAPARTVSVTGNGGPIELVLPTEMSVTKWRDLYEGGNILSVTDAGSGLVRLRLDGSQSYDLRMSRIAVTKGVANPGHRYIVPVGEGVESISSGQTAHVTFEVRDRFNNPVSGTDVTIVEDGTGNTIATKTTDEEGRVSAEVSPTSTTTYVATIAGCTSGAVCNADYEIQIPDSGLNVNPSSGVVVDGSTTDDLLGLGDLTSIAAGDVASVDFRNTESGTVEIDSMRMNHYSPDPNDHSPVTVYDPDDNSVQLEIGGPFKDASVLNPVAPASGGGTTYGFVFSGSVAQGEYFVLTVVYENGERALYFVSPASESDFLEPIL